jgi:hypothetical protein
MSQVQQFDNYAPDRFERLRTALEAKGLSLTGSSGEVKAFGADVLYAYDAAGQRLTVTVIKAPFLHSFEGFCGELQQAVAGQV